MVWLQRALPEQAAPPALLAAATAPAPARPRAAPSRLSGTLPVTAYHLPRNQSCNLEHDMNRCRIIHRLAGALRRLEANSLRRGRGGFVQPLAGPPDDPPYFELAARGGHHPPQQPPLQPLFPPPRRGRGA